MKVVAIIQARMGSSRLPGKVLRELGGRSVLACVIRRVSRFRLIDGLIIATTENPADDAIVREAERCAASVFRGSEDDVLDRYYRAAHRFHADAIVRITSDCPLIDPQVSDQTIAAFLDRRPDYANNVLQRTYPRGLDTEVMSLAALEQAWRDAREPYQREHVTPFLYQNPDRFRVLCVTGDVDYSHYRWTLDTIEDLEFLRAVYARREQAPELRWTDVLQILEREPELVAINQHVQQKTT